MQTSRQREVIAKKNYFDNLTKEYPNLGKSYNLLRNFRNTVHNNAKWDKKEPLEYIIRNKKHTINKGDYFYYEHWQLYRLVKDSISLHKKLALENKPKKLRHTTLTINGQKLSVA